MPLPIAQPQQSQPQPAPAPQDPLLALEQRRATLSGQYKQLTNAMTRGQQMAQALAKLQQLGDAITSDDVVKAFGKVVAAGAIDAHQTAVLLTDMPSTGPALAEWVSQHAALGAQALAHVDILKNEAQRQLIGTSLTSMMAHIGRGASLAQPSATPVPAAQPESEPSAGGSVAG